MNVFIEVNGIDVKEKIKTKVTLHVTIRNGRQCIGIKESDIYEVNSLINSWKYAWNLNGLKNHFKEIRFSELLDAISQLRLSVDKQDLPWYERVKMLIDSLEVK